VEIAMPEPTKSSLRSEIHDTAQEAGKQTADTTEQQTSIETASGKLEQIGSNMLLSDAQKILQLTAKFKAGDATAVEEIDAMQKKYGPLFAKDASRIIREVYTTPAQFANDVVYDGATTLRNASVINDPTYTSPEQLQIAQISNETEGKAKKMYDDRQKQLAAQTPTYQPLSTDPSMNQMYIGMAMQGAAGLLALIDPEAAAAAAGEVGAKTIDALYDRKQKVEAMNADLYKAYVKAMGKHGERGDKDWATYFNAVMKERGELRTTMQKQIDDEYKNLMKRTTDQADALKKQVDALAEQGKLSQGDANTRREAIEAKAKILNDLLKNYIDDEDKAKRLGYLYARMAQDKINTGLQYVAPQFVTKDPRTVAAMGANYDFAYGFSAKTPDQRDRFFNGMTTATAEMPEEIATLLETIDAKMNELNPEDDDFVEQAEGLRRQMLTAITGREPVNMVEMYPPSEGKMLGPNMRNADEFTKRGYMAAVRGMFSKKDEEILRAIDSKRKEESQINKEIRTAIAKDVAAEKKAEQAEVASKRKAIMDAAKRGTGAYKRALKATVGDEKADSVLSGDITIDEALAGE
jgi:DnaJ-domain-containing protein 1